MISISPFFNSDLLVPSSKLLLVAGFGWSLIRAMQKSESLECSFVGLAVGFLGLVFFRSYLAMVDGLSSALTAFVVQSGSRESVWHTLFDALKAVHQTGNHSSADPLEAVVANQDKLLGFVFKTGVWGIFTSVIELLFILASTLLEASARCLFALLEVFFPVMCALVPFSFSPMRSAFLASLEVALWAPFLVIVREVIGGVSKSYLAGEGLPSSPAGSGAAMVAVQIIAIVMILHIPKLTHLLFAGGSWSAMGVGPGNLTSIGMNTVAPRSAAVGRFLKKHMFLFLVIGWTALGTPSSAGSPDRVIRLHAGYITKVRCQGKLILSAVGNESLVERAALPSDIGCGLLLQPKMRAGRTNLLLETTTGSARRILEIAGPQAHPPVLSELEIDVGSL